MTKQRVTKRAVHDLLHEIPYTTGWTREVLRILLAVMPEIQVGNRMGAIEKAVAIVAGRPILEPKTWTPTTIRVQMISLLDELDHYCDPEAVVRAALADLIDLSASESQLQKMQEQIAAVFARLDNRTRALIEIRRELMSVDGVSNEVRFCELLDDNLGPVDVEALRNEPDLALLVDAYELACELNAML